MSPGKPSFNGKMNAEEQREGNVRGERDEEKSNRELGKDSNQTFLPPIHRKEMDSSGPPEDGGLGEMGKKSSEEFMGRMCRGLVPVEGEVLFSSSFWSRTHFQEPLF